MTYPIWNISVESRVGLELVLKEYLEQGTTLVALEAIIRAKCYSVLLHTS